ncbi:hypothetical protein JS578_02700 [Dysgonomonadaceae bacterium zrk40]|nr:hypothetical protein JS578_02700 [Dysgonomonadaceae bacterium zrk40]
MKLAIHYTNTKGYFSKRWIEYCEINNIPFKIVNCHSNDIVDNLKDCDGLLWHFSHAHHIDYQIGIKLIASLEAANKKVVPNLNSCWHFDDKVAQKYLLEAIEAPLIKSWVFYSEKEALQWMRNTSFPKVFKLKGGAGSANVKLVKNSSHARKLINKSFNTGFRQFNRKELFIYELKKWKAKKSKAKDVSIAFLKMFKKSTYEKVKGKDNGYVYFQEFLPNNDFDIRIVVIGQKAFGIKRMSRSNDFRASGSGNIIYEKNQIDERCIRIAFDVVSKLNTNCLTFDFLYDIKKEPLIAEISYGFFQDAYDYCPGYWDDQLKWHVGKFNPQGWMIEDLINNII